MVPFLNAMENPVSLVEDVRLQSVFAPIAFQRLESFGEVVG
jgi:hypothetical protein